ncbi:hypothetical protein RhiirA1_468102 [Rhizophagus irregularis]|uniref:Uncharacterized protein n=1 Tax=Rhizophagus irregularis TaxID=588596 RepID=A0A2N0RAR1_9GLOM|nr:hypothetical protein RhiirA1_468102 [Rhizophagus irregularis]
MKYGVDSNDTKKIPPFVPEPVKIDDKDEELEQCITKIKRRMGIIDSTTGSNEAVRCDLGLVLPHIYTGKDLLLESRLSHRSYRGYCGRLRRDVKKVMEAIVGLLNDRAEVDDSPDTNPSELEVLRQRNSELEAKNVELEAKIVELEKWRQRAILNEEKIDELNAENAVLVDEIFELKSENAKLRWDQQVYSRGSKTKRYRT